jgi:hypothetical protein
MDELFDISIYVEQQQQKMWRKKNSLANNNHF